MLVDNINYVKPPVQMMHNFLYQRETRISAMAKFEQEGIDMEKQALKLSILATSLLQEKVMRLSPEKAQGILSDLPALTEQERDWEAAKKELSELEEKNNAQQIMDKELFALFVTFWERFIPLYNDLWLIANRGEIDENSPEYHQFFIDLVEKEKGLGKRTVGREALFNLLK